MPRDEGRQADTEPLRPTFLIPGAQKAGTTALFHYLSLHPLVRAPARKEIDYFWVDSRYARGPQWYASQFPGRDGNRPGEQTFEATPHYLACPNSPGRMRDYDPDLRMIVLLRDPVTRAFAQYQHYRRKAGNRPAALASAARYDEPVKSFFLGLAAGRWGSFEEEIERELNAPAAAEAREFVPGLLRGGYYADHLQQLSVYFPREQWLVIEAERLRSQRVAVLEEVTRFLGLPACDWQRFALADENVGAYAPANPRTKTLLQSVFSEHNRRLFDLLGRRFTSWT